MTTDSVRLLSRVGLGLPCDEPIEDLRTRWASGKDPLPCARAGLALARRGEFQPPRGPSNFDGMMDLLGTIPAEESLAWLRRDVWTVAARVARADQVGDPRWEFETALTDLEKYQYPISFSDSLARSAVRRAGELVLAWSDFPADWLDSAAFAVTLLTGFDEFINPGDDPDDPEVPGQCAHPSVWVEAAAAAIAPVTAPYIYDGRAFHPRTQVEEMTTSVRRAAAQQREWMNHPVTDLLELSGLAPPPELLVAPRMPATPEMVAQVDDYARSILALGWREGVKYFYGHDVDGGPGLSDGAANLG